MEEKKIRNAVLQIRYKDEDTVTVNRDYYEWFLTLTEESLRVLIKQIIINRVEDVNRCICDDSKTDSDMFKVIKDPLYLISERVLQFNEETLCFVIVKPVGVSQDTDIKSRIKKKIEALNQLISDGILEIAQKHPTKEAAK